MADAWPIPRRRKAFANGWSASSPQTGLNACRLRAPCRRRPLDPVAAAVLRTMTACRGPRRSPPSRRAAASRSTGCSACRSASRSAPRSSQAALTIETQAHAPFDERFLRWQGETAGRKLRTVPMSFPDFMKTDEVMQFEYAAALGPEATPRLGRAPPPGRGGDPRRRRARGLRQLPGAATPSRAARCNGRVSASRPGGPAQRDDPSGRRTLSVLPPVPLRSARRPIRRPSPSSARAAPRSISDRPIWCSTPASISAC